jgi:hypothetical protein
MSLDLDLTIVQTDEGSERDGDLARPGSPCPHMPTTIRGTGGATVEPVSR